MTSMTELLKAIERLHAAERYGLSIADAWVSVDYFAQMVRVRVQNFALDALID